MSYCRWSSDNFKCDICAYHGVFGYVIHVAHTKVVGDIPKCDYSFLQDDTPENRDKYISSAKIRDQWMDKCERVKIGLSYDGETFSYEDIEDFYAMLLKLKQVGYCVPDSVLECVLDEINEGMDSINK